MVSGTASGSTLTIEELRKQMQAFVGGEVYIEAAHSTMRAGISSCSIHGGELRLGLSWAGTLAGGSLRASQAHQAQFRLARYSTPRPNRPGTFVIDFPAIRRHLTFYPKGHPSNIGEKKKEDPAPRTTEWHF